MGEIIPELVVVGAGPGDPELITVKAHKALQTADVILFDNLINKELLNLAADTCEKIYVGKQPYGNYTSQEAIHELIKEKAYSKGKVIRLKGGDPFIFGRGYEEMLFARENGIVSSYIPGITSMQAVGFENIPLTHRNISESLWVVTGTKKDGTLSEDLLLAMQSKATLVIYMGMKKLPEIAATYILGGKGDTPAAVIQHASLPFKKCVRGLIKDMPQLVSDNKLTHPAIIIIGRITDIENSLI